MVKRIILMNSNNKVLLIYPYIVSSSEDIDIPLNLLCIGSFLKSEGFRVRILNHYAEKSRFDELLSAELDDCLCVGLTVMTAQLPDALRIVKRIKERRPELPVVFGGAHATLFPEQTVQHPMIDYTVIGEGELSFLELLQCLRENRDPKDVGGIAWRNAQGQIQVNHEKPAFDFNRMPRMDFSLFSRELLEKTAAYRIPIQTSRGCPYRCRFCINTILPENRRWRCWDVQRTADEIENVLKLNPRIIYFYDEFFFSSKKRIQELFAEIKRRNLKFKWLATMRADCLDERRIDQELLDELGKCGFQLAAIGAESGSNRVLDLIQKDITVDDLVRSAQMFNKTGIIPQYSFMIGVPGEIREDTIQTVEVIRKLSELCPGARFLGPQLFRPYPGSELYRECIKYGWSEPKGIEDWCSRMEKEMIHTTPEVLPWITDKKFVLVMWFYAIFIALRTGALVRLFIQYSKEYRRGLLFTIMGIAGMVVFSWLGKLRYKFKFYALPWEIELFKKYRFRLSS